MNRRAGAARIAVGVACAAGLLHAASSFYWALGGRWLLPTVGEWAVEMAEHSPREAALSLGAIGFVKATAAVVPVLVAAGRFPWARFWRGACWVGGSALALYGGLHVVVSGAVLLGVIRPDGGYNAEAMIGHALLWGPLFLLWGVALIVWLRFSAGENR